MEIGAYIEANRGRLEAWGKMVAEEISANHAKLLKMQPSIRVKDVESAREKQVRKGYGDPTREMTDLVGVRFIVLTTDHLEPIRSHLSQSGYWKCTQTRNPDIEAANDPSSFSYQSHHYELRSKEESDDALCCEVQVRTLLQHTIAELSHDAFYKATQAAPSQAQRLVARSIALMETTDELLCSAMKAVEEAQAPALALRREIMDSASFIGTGGDDLVNELLCAYQNAIDADSKASFKQMLSENSFIAERIQSRTDGIFSYPAAALLSYWIASRLKRKAPRSWPFPGSTRDLELILSDLGE